MFYDDGVTGSLPTSWKSSSQNLAISRDENGTTLTNNHTSHTYLSLDKSGTSSDLYDWNTPLCLEFDFEKLNSETTINSQIHFFDRENNNYQLWLDSNGHYIIRVTENRVTATCDGVNKTSKTVEIDTTLIRFYLQSGASLRFKNFKLYPI